MPDVADEAALTARERLADDLCRATWLIPQGEATPFASDPAFRDEWLRAADYVLANYARVERVA